MKKMNTKDNAGRMSTNYPLLDSYLTLTRPLHAYRSIVYFFAVFAMLLFGGWNTQAWAQLPYNTTMTSTHYNDSKVKVGSDGESYSQNAWSGGIFLQAGTRKNLWGTIKGEEWNWEDKYVIIALKTNSIPYQLKFKYKCNSLIATNPDWYVAESSDKSNWTTIWSTESNSISTSALQTVDLSKSTKYIKFCYSGNYGGTYSDIKVTDQAYVHNPKVGDDEISSLDFGSGTISSGKAELSFDVEWCNVSALSVTSSNTAFFTVSPSYFGNTAKYATQTVTVYYNRDVAVGNNHSGTITISNNNATYTKTVTVTGTTTKRPQEIHWDASLAAVNYTLNAEESLTGSAIATADKEDAVITYSSDNLSAIAVSPDGKTLMAIATGTANITATAAGSDIYAEGTDTKTFTVTAKKKQTITWDQNLMGLKTNASPNTINLNANATSNGTITYSIEAGSEGCITLGGANNSVMTITGIPGTAYIKASQAGGTIGGEEWIAATAIKQVKVRDPNSSCDEYAISDESFTFSSGDKTSMSEKVFNLTGKPTTLTFKAKRGGLKFLWSEQKDLYLEQYANFGSGLEWRQVIAIQPETSEGKYGPYPLEETATKIRFRSGEYAEQQVYNITSARKTIFDVSETSITDDAERNVKWSKTISVTRSNIDVMDISVSSDDSSCPFQLSKTSIGTDCADMNTETFEVFFTPTAKNKTYTGTITITDGKATNTHTATIPLSITTVAFNQAITWNFEDNQTFPSTNVPLEFDATTDATGLEVSYKLASGDEARATLEGNKVTFISSGTIHVTAYQEGNDRYNAAVEVTKTIKISAVTPTLTAPTKGTEIQYLQTLNNSTIAKDGVATVTLRGENTEVAGTWSWSNPTQVIKENAGTHEYQVTFTPTDGGMYTTNTCMVPVRILRTTQSIAMNNGTVKVAVDGLDKGAADSKIDLDDLIASQTSDVVSGDQRAGAVSYEVISAQKTDKANATIGEGNVFSATVCDTYTIRATKAQTDYYNEVTADFTVTVGKRANTLTIAGTEYEQFVDDVVEDVRSKQNSDGAIHTSSTNENLVYYNIEQNKIFIPNRDAQMFGQYTVDTIKIWQDATDRFEASGEKTIIVTVKKYVTALNGNDSILKVNETLTANYVFTNTSAQYPSNNNEDDFYYTIDKPNFENEALNKGDQLITYNPETNEITGHNAGTTKITFFQKETYKYTGATLMHNISVEKRDNQISNSWNNTWQQAMDENATAHISFSSTHGDYTNYPISIEQIYGADVATLTGDAAMASITTNTTKGYSIWHLSQAENYEYYAAEADVMVMVGVPAPPTCYVYEDYKEHKFITEITDAEGHFESPIAINSPIDKIWFKAKRQWGGFNYFTVQYSTDNEKTWSTVTSPNLGTDYAEYSASFPTLSSDKRITHVRFGAKTGATLNKWYKDVRISRKAYLNILDADSKKISKLPAMTCTVDTASTAEAKFYIDYSTCADKIYIESSDTAHFTVSCSEITANGDNLSAKEEITVTYSSTELGEHNAVITIRTSYQTCALSVSGKTEKRTPTITWQENFTNNPLTLPVGLTVNATKPAATTTSTALIKYESSDPDVIEIIEEGYAFKVVGKGTATLTAIVPENEVWKSTSDSREINATDKVVQEIVWDQTFPRFMEPGNVIDLDAKVFLRNLSTNALTYSEERTQYITYSCPLNNGIVSVNGNKMTVLNYDEVKVTASVGGNADYEAASMTVLITVRKPSVGCETPLVLNRENAIDMYEWDVDFSNYANLTTEEMISGEIKIDHSNGKPDKLSFQYEGEEFKIGLLKLFGGVIKFEQRVNSQWISVEGSRVETVKNEWNAKSGLQLYENADALRIIREKGATGHHYIKNIQVTRKQYLRATKNTIDLGEIKIGQTTPVTIGFDYSDVKGDLTARTINNTTDVTIKDNGAIDLECGSFGHYDLPVTFTPSQVGDWEGTIEVYDNIANLSITIHLTATVKANEEYIFNHEGDWNTNTNWTTNLVPDENADITVAKDMIINSSASVKSITIEEGVTVTVKSGMTLVIGNGIPKSREIYGNLHVEDGAQVILKEGATLPLNDFTLDAALGTIGTSASSGQVEGESNLRVDGDAYFQLTLNPTGNNTLGWYDFVLPFEANVSNGISVVDNEGNVLPSRYGTHYLVMRYDEAQRAVNGKDWFKYNGTMEAGRVYTIAVDADHSEWNTVLFKKNKGAVLGAPVSYQAEYSNTGAAEDCGWNGLGNGTLRHMKLQDASAKIQVYDHVNNVFETREDVSGLKFAVGTSFFMQVDEAKAINFVAPTSAQSLLAPARERHIEEFRLALTAEGEERASDRLWVSASEEATGAYVIGHDLLKMGTPAEAKVAQMWANNAGNRLCDIEMPLNGDGARCELGLFAPKESSYTLSVEKAPEDVTLYLTYNDRPIWNLSMSPYVLDLTNGTTEGYGLQLYVRPASEVATGVDEVQGNNVPCTKVLMDGKMYIITPEGAIFDATGKKVK